MMSMEERRNEILGQQAQVGHGCEEGCETAREELHEVSKTTHWLPAFARTLNFTKHVFSLCLEMAALFVILYGMVNGHAVLKGNPIVLVLLFVFCVTLLAYLEGLQVAILALQGTDGSAFRDSHPRAFRIQNAMLKESNVQRFLVGRQFYVIFVVYLCAQVTTFPTFPSFGMPEMLKVILIDTGLPGALFVLAVGQLMPQLTAARHPVAFMNIPGSYAVVIIALCLESIGVTHFSWLLTEIVCRLFFSGSGASKSTKAANAKAVEVASDTKGENTSEDTASTTTPPSDDTPEIDLEAGAMK